jgi:hypothetical protein
MLDEYIGGHIAVTSASICVAASDNSKALMILNKEHSKMIYIVLNGKTGDIDMITEQEIAKPEPKGKIIQFRRLKEAEDK